MASHATRAVSFVQHRGFWAVLACRVCPLVPSELVSLASGVTGVRFGAFLGATVLGMAPTAFLYASFGFAILDPNEASTRDALIVGFALLTLITGLMLVGLWRRDGTRLRSES